MVEKYNAEVLKSKKFLKLMNIIESLAKKVTDKKLDVPDFSVELIKYGYTSIQAMDLERLLKTLNSDGKINIGNEKDKIMVDFDVYMTQELPELGTEPTKAECELNLKNYMELKKEHDLAEEEKLKRENDEYNAIASGEIVLYELHEIVGFDDNGNYDENYDKLVHTFTSYEDATDMLNRYVNIMGYGPSELEIKENIVDLSSLDNNINYQKTKKKLASLDDQYRIESVKEEISELSEDLNRKRIGISQFNIELLKKGFSSEQVINFQNLYEKREELNNDDYSNTLLINLNTEEQPEFISLNDYIKKEVPYFGYHASYDELPKEYESEFNKYLNVQEIHNQFYETNKADWEQFFNDLHKQLNDQETKIEDKKEMEWE